MVDRSMKVEAVCVGGNACLCPQILMGGDDGEESILLAVGNVIQNVAVSSGLLKGTYRSHRDLINAMCIVKSNSTQLVVSSSFDGQIELWNPETFETLHSFHVNRPVIKLINVPFWIEKMDESEDNHSSVKVDYIVALARSSNPEKKSFDILKISLSDLLTGQSDKFVSFGSTLTPRLESFAFDTTSNSGNGASLFRTYHSLIANGKKGLNFLICAEREGLNSQQSCVYYSMNDPVIAFAANISSGSIAVGHDNGQISILSNVVEFLRQFWQQGNKKSGEVLAAMHHWHAHPVMSLCFSYDGSLLYSGGEENVLVIWDLKNAGRNYLPRLGAPICRIIAGQSVQRTGHVLITTIDNAVRLVNVANFEVEWMWQSANISTSLNIFQYRNKSTIESSSSSATTILAKAISPEQQRILLLRSLQPYRFQEDHAERAWFAQCLINPRTGNLLINGNPGILQEFDFFNGIIRQNHPLLQHHRVSRKDPGMRMFLPTITRFAVDASGRLLVTVDVKRGEEQPKEYSLKIWEWFADNESDLMGSGEYRIVAQLDKPHGDYPVTSLAVSQLASVASDSSNDQVLHSVMIATGSNDGTIKMWTRKANEEVSDIYNNSVITTNSDSQENTKSNSAANNNSKKQYILHKLRWKCHYAFTYRLAPVLAVTFSLDSSLLIVAHDNLITCWDPQTVALRASLTLSIPRKITYLSVIEPRAASDYGQGVGDVYLVAGTNVSVSVFSLLSAKELWSVDGMDVESIATASNESFSWSARVDAQHQYRFQSTVADEGWIAIAASTPPSPTAVNNSEGQQAVSPHHSVMVYSPLSARPLLHEQVSFSSKITSLAFLRRQGAADAATAVMGLAALSADSDVWIVQPSQHVCSFQPGVTALVGEKAASSLTSTTTTSSSSRVATATTVAHVKAPKLPTVMFNKDVSVHIESANDLSARMTKPMKAAAPMGRALASKDWLRSLLPENTEDLPKISDIAGSYLRSMMDNSVSAKGTSSSSSSIATSVLFSTNESKSHHAAHSASTASVMEASKIGSVTVFPAQDTDELLRRVSAKWDSALGKRSASHASSGDARGEGEKTPGKRNKKDKDAVGTPVATSKLVDAEKAPRSSAVKKNASASIETRLSEPEKDVPSTTATEEAVAQSNVLRTPSSRKRKGSDVSTERIYLNQVHDDGDAKIITRRTSSRRSMNSSISSSSNMIVPGEDDDDDDVSDAASTATDVTTPSVASARRSARLQTNSLLAVASATPLVVISAEGTRSSRSRK